MTVAVLAGPSSRMYREPPPEDLKALVWPSNGSTTTRFQFTTTRPSLTAATLIWRRWVTQQNGYFTTFFFGPTDGSFSATPTYWGCHPYPDSPPDGNIASWEVSSDGEDDIVDENSNDTSVEYDRWHTQAATSRDAGANSIIDFFWDLPNTNKIISHTTDPGELSESENSPGLIFGDAPWNDGDEMLSGKIRGIMVFTERLSDASILALSVLETDAQVLTKCTELGITSLWYLNMNPTPTDINDKSGNGHHPSWVGAARPTGEDYEA